MIPESDQGNSVRLYKAGDFPTKWSFVSTLLQGNYVDTTLLRYHGKWWMFTAAQKHNDTLYLYYADTLAGPWTAHPGSPIIKGDPGTARPGGRVVQYDNRIIRYAQDCTRCYGNQVRAFQVTKLTAIDYEEQEVSESPIVQASGKGWNKKGMHTIDPHQIGQEQWIAAVDGFEKDLIFVAY